jgi:hypothetical protein
MIQCDRCEGWFHGQCVSVTVEEAQKMDEFVCPPLHICVDFSMQEVEAGPQSGTQEEASRVLTPRNGGRSGFQGSPSG